MTANIHSAAVRRFSISCAASPRMHSAAHRHSLTRITQACRVRTGTSAHAHAARVDKPSLFSKNPNISYQNQPPALSDAGKYAINAVATRILWQNPSVKYDSLERLSQIKYINNAGQAGEQLLEQIDYGYDANGRRTSKTTLNNNGVGQGETPMNATYDAANRMTAITLNIAGSTQTYNLSYEPRVRSQYCSFR